MRIEIWKDIVGLEGKYQISNFGRVKSLCRVIGFGKGYRKPEKILRNQQDSDGYEQVTITVNGRKNKTFKVHKLVAVHFISETLPENHHLCHKDGNKENNHVENLYIGDVISNVQDRYRHHKTTLTIRDVQTIKSLIGSLPQKDIARLFGVRANYISRIKTGARAAWIK